MCEFVCESDDDDVGIICGKIYDDIALGAWTESEPKIVRVCE